MKLKRSQRNRVGHTFILKLELPVYVEAGERGDEGPVGASSATTFFQIRAKKYPQTQK